MNDDDRAVTTILGIMANKILDVVPEDAPCHIVVLCARQGSDGGMLVVSAANCSEELCSELFTAVAGQKPMFAEVVVRKREKDEGAN